MEPKEPTPLGEAIRGLVHFLGTEPFTTKVARLEHDLVGVPATEIGVVVADAGITAELLAQAMTARRHLGRINDVIHAASIALSLPRLLESDEKLLRPSLAAGNDLTRPFDVETDRRVAEFKLARWDGADAMRKRQVFKDLVNLTADDSGRRAELYVIGAKPLRFLRSSRSSAGWALDRSPREREVFKGRFGPLGTTVAAFTATAAAHVTLFDLEVELPDVFATLDVEVPWESEE